jgi:hypothetical protein
LELFLNKTADALEKMRRIEGRVAADQDLKLSDLLRSIRSFEYFPSVRQK